MQEFDWLFLIGMWSAITVCLQSNLSEILYQVVHVHVATGRNPL